MGERLQKVVVITSGSKTTDSIRFIFGNRSCFQCLDVFMASEVPYISQKDHELSPLNPRGISQHRQG